MSIQSINVSFWKQSTGLTGQNLNEDNARKFDSVARKFNKKTGLKLSKMAAYRASRSVARELKAEYGSRIVSNSKTTFELLLTGVDKTLDRKNHNIDLGTFDISSITDLACKPTGRKKSA